MKTFFLLFVFLIVTICIIPGCSCQRDEVATDCLIDNGACTKTTDSGNITVIFDISPKPVKTVSDLIFCVELHRGVTSVPDAEVNLELSMPGMYMARNKVILEHKGKGRYEGKGVIVRCPSGRKKWKADVVIKDVRNKPVTEMKAAFIFEVGT